MCVEVCIDMNKEMCIDMCTELCIDMCTELCIDMCMRIDFRIASHLHRYEHQDRGASLLPVLAYPPPPQTKGHIPRRRRLEGTMARCISLSASVCLCLSVSVSLRGLYLCLSCLPLVSVPVSPSLRLSLSVRYCSVPTLLCATRCSVGPRLCWP